MRAARPCTSPGAGRLLPSIGGRALGGSVAQWQQQRLTKINKKNLKITTTSISLSLYRGEERALGGEVTQRQRLKKLKTSTKSYPL